MVFRVATWNLDHASHGNRPIPAQLAKIEQIDADIIVLTETCPEVDLSSMDYVGLAAERNKYKKNYSAIWSKWPIVRHGSETYDPVTATCAWVKSPFGSFVIYGTILTWRNDRGPNPKLRSGSWVQHDKEIGMQGDDWYRIQSESNGLPLIVAGDFNQSRDGVGTYRSPMGVNLLDEQLQRNNLTCLTDEDFGARGKLCPDPKKGYCRHNIDHICVTRDWVDVVRIGAWDHFTAAEELSDHNGVFADLVLNSANG